jgi:hypothetical protein
MAEYLPLFFNRRECGEASSLFRLFWFGPSFAPDASQVNSELLCAARIISRFHREVAARKVDIENVVCT